VLPPDQLADDDDNVHMVADALELVEGLRQTDQFAVCAGRQMLSYTLGQQVAAGCDVASAVGPVGLDMSIPDVFRQTILSSLARQRVVTAGDQ
jgi:hypothetical protein